MKIREIMTTNICCASENDTLAAVASYMKTNDTGFIPVNGQNGELCGIITDRDIVIRAVADSEKAPTLHASDIMSRDIVTLSPDTPLCSTKAIILFTIPFPIPNP